MCLNGKCCTMLTPDNWFVNTCISIMIDYDGPDMDTQYVLSFVCTAFGK